MQVACIVRYLLVAALAQGSLISVRCAVMYASIVEFFQAPRAVKETADALPTTCKIRHVPSPFSSTGIKN